ncbi:MAG: STAS-like domain-containing protein [Pseudomonadales bacterium]|nr:STAS-like domain-containing protein [Pseudomonadales bacterium]MEC9039614.1 STAS-like domain-containing protein [Pseudomonadota bacterium]
MKTIRVREFTEFPGPRYRDLGPYSGEEFREKILVPAIKEHGGNITIDLDGTFGYGSSFLEEAFGGLIRNKSITTEQANELASHIISEEDPSLAEEVRSYLTDASSNSQEDWL